MSVWWTDSPMPSDHEEKPNDKCGYLDPSDNQCRDEKHVVEEWNKSGWVVIRDLGFHFYIVPYDGGQFNCAKGDNVGQNHDAESYGRGRGEVDIQVTETYGEADLTV